MINSVLLTLSQLNCKFSEVFKILWLSYVFIIEKDTNFRFFYVCMFSFICLTLINRYLKKLFFEIDLYLSAVSILIYSCVIDIVCYFAFPTEYSMSRTLLEYVKDGLLFNSKYLPLNILVVMAYSLFLKIKLFVRNRATMSRTVSF